MDGIFDEQIFGSEQFDCINIVEKPRQDELIVIPPKGSLIDILHEKLY